MLRTHWAHIEALDRIIGELDEQIEEHVRPFSETIELLDRVPGIGETTAQSLIAEIGVDRGQFANHHHLASWAGMSPGNNESAGKRKSGTTAKGNRCYGLRLARLRTRLLATRAATYQRAIVGWRPGGASDRAIVAIGHQILTIVYFIIKDRAVYDDLGEHYYERQRQEQLKRHHIKRLQRLGYRVEVAEALPAA